VQLLDIVRRDDDDTVVVPFNLEAIVDVFHEDNLANTPHGFQLLRCGNFIGRLYNRNPLGSSRHPHLY
jgi:hypothetical protein